MFTDKELDRALENWDGTKITIRPSSVDSFLACPRQWAMTFLGGISSIPSARAAIGTAIHAAAEQGWKESIAAKTKMFGAVDSLTGLAVDNLVEADQESDLEFEPGLDLEQSIGLVRMGVKTFIEDIVPFTDIPVAVEERLSINLDHSVVERVSGTVDYIADGVIGDLKTSKRKPVPASHQTQQSIYKLLAEENGYDIKHNLIQGVVLKAKPEGHILELDANIPKAKAAVNSLLTTLDAFASGNVRPSLLFRGNPKYYLCDNKYCAFYNDCPFTQGV